MSNAALRNLQRTQAASGGAPRWSVLLAAAGAGDDFTINSAVMFDLTDSPNYGLITLGASAVLTIDSTKHTRLNCAGMIRSMGSKYLAYPTYAATHTLNLTGTRARETASIPGNISAPLTAVPSANRAMLGMAGSERRWISQGLPADVIVKLLINASAGATSITLDRPVTWKAGWKIHHTSTAYYDEGDHSETVTIAADVNNSATVTITGAGTGGGLQWFHHGQLQYVVPPAYEGRAGTNLSYTQRTTLSTDSFGTSGGAAYLGARVLSTIAAGASPIIDNRCTVFLMTYPMKVTSVNPTTGLKDSDSTTHGYNHTDMTMGLSSIDMLDGIESINPGKAGTLGAYPFHDHLSSYIGLGSTGSGTFLGDVNPALRYMKRISVVNSTNRALSVHGHCGGSYEDIVAVNTDTTPFFLGEDASEERNTFNRLWYSNVNLIGYGKTQIKLHDGYQSIYAGEVGPPGIWFTNPNNHLTNCGGSRGHVGGWNAFPIAQFRVGSVTGSRTGSTYLETRASYSENNEFLRASATAVPETITLTATSTTTFSRVGSVSGAMSALTVGAATTYHVGYAWGYKIPAGTAVVGDTYVFALQRFCGPVGKSKDVRLNPGRTPFLEWNNNEFHSSKYKNMVTGGGAADEAGQSQFFGFTTPELGSIQNQRDYTCGSHETGTLFDDTVPAADPDVMTGANLWKCGASDGQYVHVFGWIYYNNFRTSCMRDGAGFRGVVDGRFRKWTVSASSLDDAHYTDSKGVLMVSYHNGITRQDCLFLPAPQTGITYKGQGNATALYQEGGALGLNDYYTDQVLTLVADTNNCILGTNPGNHGFRDPPSYMSSHDSSYGLTGFYTGSEYPAFYVSGSGGDPANAAGVYMKGNAGAIRLPTDGHVYNSAAGWWVYAKPTDSNDGFYTYGTTGGIFADAPPGVTNKNGKLLSSTYKFYGFKVEYAEPASFPGGNAIDNEAITYTRLASDGTTAVDTWSFPMADHGTAFSNMRHCSMIDGGIYRVAWPNRTRVPLMNVLSGPLSLFGNGGKFVIGIDYDGAVTLGANPMVRMNRYGGYSSIGGVGVGTPVASKALVLSATGSTKYWLDTTNNVLWIAFINDAIFETQVPGFTQDPTAAGDLTGDSAVAKVYRKMYYEIRLNNNASF